MYYATIQELIDSVDKNEISYRNLHTYVYMKDDVANSKIKIPYKSIIGEYLPFFSKAVVTAHMTDEEIVMYKNQPKRLSQDLYGTTELWSALLELNNMISIVDFDVSKLKVWHPKMFKELLNEVMILEGIID